MGKDRGPAEIWGREYKSLQDFCTQIDLEISTPELLKQAFSHSSYTGGRLNSNERLEFLGDSVVGMAVSNHIFRNYPEEREGVMTELKSRVVSGETFTRRAKELGIDTVILLGKGVVNQASLPDSILADAFEALVAAIYLDQGYERAERFIISQLEDEIKNAMASLGQSNFKSLLQEAMQKQGKEPPTYEIEGESGPEHCKTFFVAVRVDGCKLARGEGQNKKEAEQKAAAAALESMDANHGDS